MNFLGVTFSKEFINVSRDSEVARGLSLSTRDGCDVRVRERFRKIISE